MLPGNNYSTHRDTLTASAHLDTFLPLLVDRWRLRLSWLLDKPGERAQGALPLRHSRAWHHTQDPLTRHQLPKDVPRSLPRRERAPLRQLF